MEKLLAYGAVGLGLALAMLAYWLLSQEQRARNPRKLILQSVHIFMAFALVLAIGGLFLEYHKSEASQLPAVRKQMEQLASDLTAERQRSVQLERNLQKTSTALEAVHSSIRDLMDIKDGALGRFQKADPDEPGYQSRVQELVLQVQDIDNKLTVAAGGPGGIVQQP
jgi:hypothetical protein